MAAGEPSQIQQPERNHQQNNPNPTPCCTSKAKPSLGKGIPIPGAAFPLTCTFPCARVMMSMLSPFCLYSRMQALYLAVRMNSKSLLSPCPKKNPDHANSRGAGHSHPAPPRRARLHPCSSSTHLGAEELHDGGFSVHPHFLDGPEPLGRHDVDLQPGVLGDQQVQVLRRGEVSWEKREGIPEEGSAGTSGCRAALPQPPWSIPKSQHVPSTVPSALSQLLSLSLHSLFFPRNALPTVFSQEFSFLGALPTTPSTPRALDRKRHV